MSDVLYTVPEVAKQIKCSRGDTYALIKKGHIPALKIGSLKVRKSALDDFLKRMEGHEIDGSGEVVELKLEQ